MKDFTEQIISALINRLPDSVNITIQEISKPGEKNLTGLCIRADDSNIVPVIYLDQMFDAYQHGTSLHTIVDHLCSIYQQNCIPTNFDTTLLTDWTQASAHVYARLINIPHNSDYLQGKVVTAIPTTDIGFLYCIDIDNLSDASASTPVTDHLLSSWNISLETLHTTALANTQNIMQPVVRPMGAMMQELGAGDEEEILLSSSPTMYVITSRQMLNGAILSILPAVTAQIQRSLGAFYLLPSSVHEMLAVPKAFGDPADLLKMVIQINHSQVEPKDRLSDDVFIIRNGQLASALSPEQRDSIRYYMLDNLPFPEVD